MDRNTKLLAEWTVALGTLFAWAQDWLPTVAALLSAIWTGLKIIEMVAGWVKRRRHKREFDE